MARISQMRSSIAIQVFALVISVYLYFMSHYIGVYILLSTSLLHTLISNNSKNHFRYQLGQFCSLILLLECIVLLLIISFIDTSQLDEYKHDISVLSYQHVIDIHRNGNLKLKRKKTEILDLSGLELSYPLFPIKLFQINSSELISSSSLTLIRTVFGEDFPFVDFPDLKYRNKSEVHFALPNIFESVPEAFIENVQNPCWLHSKGEGGDRSIECLPYAYILGQPKCGTTDLFERLKGHPRIRMPVRKEIRWFTRGEFATGPLMHETNAQPKPRVPNSQPLLGPGSSIFDYTRWFKGLATFIERQLEDQGTAGQSQGAVDSITIDGGPHTFWWPTQSPDGHFLPEDIPAPQIIREIQPSARFLLTFSDPVRRLYSDYYFLGDNLLPVALPRRSRGRAALDVEGSIHRKSAKELHDRVVQQVHQFHQCVATYQHRLRQLLLQVGNTSTHREEVIDPIWFRASQMCAHDRHRFGIGGWGRLSIGLYVLYLEKWLEHFPIDQFLLLRLEDYEINPKSYMDKVFSFLNVGDPSPQLPFETSPDWKRILSKRHFNAYHETAGKTSETAGKASADRMEDEVDSREAILEETETLLRDFYRPYNDALKKFTQLGHFTISSDTPRSFLWELTIDASNQTITLRREQLMKQHPPDPLVSPSDPLTSPILFNDSSTEALSLPHNPHNIEHLFLSPPPLVSNPNPLVVDPPPSLRGIQIDHLLHLSPKRFDLTGLQIESQFGDLLTMKKIDQALVSRTLTANALCTAAVSMNFAALQYLLYDVGVDPNDLILQDDGHRNALHCLAFLNMMADANAKSHVFALLKGKPSWISQFFVPPMEPFQTSVLARDIVDRLGVNMVRVAQWLHRAGIQVNYQDIFGTTPLHIAAAGGETHLVQYILSDTSVDLALRDGNDRTALHFAAAYGHAAICGMLVRSGADPHTLDRYLVTPWDVFTNPGPISPNEAITYLNVTQRPARQIQRLLHPERPPATPSDEVLRRNLSSMQARWLHWGHPQGSRDAAAAANLDETAVSEDQSREENGGWSSERLKGYEDAMECSAMDQYWADEITGEQLFQKYLATNSPVLIRGLIHDWKVIDLFSMDKLKANYGSMCVEVSNIPYAVKFGGSQKIDMSLSEYIDEVKQHRMEGGNHPWYVFRGHRIPDDSESYTMKHRRSKGSQHVTGLDAVQESQSIGKESLVAVTNCPTPDLLDTAFDRFTPSSSSHASDTKRRATDLLQKRIDHFINAQWAFGGEGTGAPIHFHNTAWNALVYGAKQWIIYPPHNMIMSNRQILDYLQNEEPVMETRSSEPVLPMTCVQTAGDVLIIPESWGHGVLNIQESIAIATEVKQSLWRIKPTSKVLSLLPNFDNRSSRPKL